MGSIDKKAFGKRLAQKRKEAGMSASKLGARVGMKQQSISSIERGDVARPGKLLELARELGVTEEWLLYGDKGAPEPRTKKAPISPASAQSPPDLPRLVGMMTWLLVWRGLPEDEAENLAKAVVDYACRPPDLGERVPTRARMRTDVEALVQLYGPQEH